MDNGENRFLPQARTHSYLSHLVRLWQDTPDAPWRTSIQNVATDDRRGFANLESLAAFLREQSEQTTQAEKGETHDHLWKQKP